jgi:hypothetical protein
MEEVPSSILWPGIQGDIFATQLRLGKRKRQRGLPYYSAVPLKSHNNKTLSPLYMKNIKIVGSNLLAWDKDKEKQIMLGRVETRVCRSFPFSFETGQILAKTVSFRTEKKFQAKPFVRNGDNVSENRFA